MRPNEVLLKHAQRKTKSKHFIRISALIPETKVLKCRTKCLSLKENIDVICILNVAGG